MKIEYHKYYSYNLNRDMEFKVYGHGGKPVIIVPTQCGRFYEFEDFKMLDVYAPYIEDGVIQVFTIDAIDGETYVGEGDPRQKIERHEAWIRYIMEEAVPIFSSINGTANGWEMKFGVAGCSMGAMHAANLYFRFPDVFDCLLALSGMYSNEYYFGDYHDDLTYANSPEQFLGGMPEDHPYIEKYNQGKMIICVGQGAWEGPLLESTRNLQKILVKKNIHAFVDFWGYDVCHDWNWWFVQAEYFLPKLFLY